MELAKVEAAQDGFLPFSGTGIVPLHSRVRRYLALYAWLWTTLCFGSGYTFLMSFSLEKNLIYPSSEEF